MEGIQKKLNLRDNYNRTYSLSKNDDTKQMFDYSVDTKNKVYKFINDNLYKNTHVNNDVVNYYKKKGYDAIVDAEDWSGGADYPLIVFDSEKNLKRVKQDQMMNITISNDEVSRKSEIYEFVNDNLCKGSPIIEEIIDIFKEEKDGKLYNNQC